MKIEINLVQKNIIQVHQLIRSYQLLILLIRPIRNSLNYVIIAWMKRGIMINFLISIRILVSFSISPIPLLLNSLRFDRFGWMAAKIDIIKFAPFIIRELCLLFSFWALEFWPILILALTVLCRKRTKTDFHYW